jgi:SAM-dependent methyltransferase
MDVLQHLTTAGAAAAVAEMARVLRPGGRLLVRTNAAFGRRHVAEREDWRLYRPETLRATLCSSGLEVAALTPVNALQALWASVPRGWSRPRHEAHSNAAGEDAHRAEWGVAGLGIPTKVHPVINTVLLGLLRLEALWLSRPGRHLPFGHSLYAVARRPARSG